jgi:transposase-like protein
MLSLFPEVRSVNGRTTLQALIQETHGTLRLFMGQRLTGQLNQAVDHILGRLRYERRASVPDHLEHLGRCAKCGSPLSHRGSRNGSRERTLTTLWGDIQFDLPRVRCECGGSMALRFDGLLRPYQRLGDDVDAQIQRWGQMSLSLRQMQAELAHGFVGPLGLRTLTERLHQLQGLTPDLASPEVPPIVQVDAIWFTQLRPNGKLRQDAKGRQRAAKGRFKRCILIARGVWPTRGRREILAWDLADGEDAAAWLKFLSRLEEQGIRSTQGLCLIIHDGGDGLCVALRSVNFGAAEQRCLFHKLHNIARAIELPEGLSRQERSCRRKAILKDFRAIWEAKDYGTVLRRYLQVVRQYRTSQPAAVAALRRDFRATLTYYQIEQQHPTWQRRHLRTTSRLERFNRTLRRHIRAAGAYHSDDGILAVVAQEADRFFSAGTRKVQA